MSWDLFISLGGSAAIFAFIWWCVTRFFSWCRKFDALQSDFKALMIDLGTSLTMSEVPTNMTIQKYNSFWCRVDSHILTQKERDFMCGFGLEILKSLTNKDLDAFGTVMRRCDEAFSLVNTPKLHIFSNFKEFMKCSCAGI